MPDSTTTDTTALAADVPFSERTRLVMAACPDLIEALERASEESYLNEESWQEEVARQQRAAGLPKRRLESPYGRALREASTAVVEKSKELLAAGALRGPGRPTGTE